MKNFMKVFSFESIEDTIIEFISPITRKTETNSIIKFNNCELLVYFLSMVKGQKFDYISMDTDNVKYPLMRFVKGESSGIWTVQNFIFEKFSLINN